MAAAAVNLNLEIVLAGGEAALADIDRTRRGGRIVVLAVNFIHGEPLEKAIVDHGMGALSRLLRGLKQELHRTVKVPALGQQLRSPQNRRHMAVMAAAVHFPLMLGFVGNGSRLRERNRIHIRPQGHDLRAVPDLQASDHARAADAGVHLNSHLPQPLRHKGRGAGLLKRRLRMAMEFVTPCF